MAKILTLLIAAMVLVQPVEAVAAKVSAVLSNGPPEKRINFVILAEGYQAFEESKFLSDATNTINNLLVNQPFLEYGSYFNAFAIFVESQESGADHPASNIWKNTYFNSTFDTFGRADLLSIPPNNFDNNAANGEGKVTSLAEDVFPLYDVPIVIVNDSKTGGSAGRMAVVSAAPGSREILAHEMGHGFAGLGDEYETPAIFPDIEEPNTTRETNRALIKWRAWIKPDTLIPTPNKPPGSFTNANRVGLFEGAHYHSNGWYRPKLNCKMRSYGAAFCEVCSEALVKAMYERVRPVEFQSPMGNVVSVQDQQESVQFEVRTLRPRTAALHLQWYLDGAVLENQTNALFTLQISSLNAGNHSVLARIEDRTALVRNDPTGLLKQEISWTIEKAASGGPIGIQNPRLEGNQLVFSVTNVSASYVLERSTNLLLWLPIATNQSSVSTVGVLVTNQSGEFFRLKR